MAFFTAAVKGIQHFFLFRTLFRCKHRKLQKMREKQTLYA